MTAVDEAIGNDSATLPKDNPTLETAVLQIVAKSNRKAALKAKKRVKFAELKHKKRKASSVPIQTPPNATKKGLKKAKTGPTKARTGPETQPNNAPQNAKAIREAKEPVGQKEPQANDRTGKGTKGTVNNPKKTNAQKQKAKKAHKKGKKWKRSKNQK
jgi:hypothetical protein